jgi:hypothetical protein
VREVCRTAQDWREHFVECGVSGTDIEYLVPSFTSLVDD